MVVETLIAAAPEIAKVAEVAKETVEGTAESSISGASELSETLAAIEQEVPREVIAERVEAMLQDPNRQLEVLDVHTKTGVPFEYKAVERNGELIIERFPDFSEHSPFECQLPEDLYGQSDYLQEKHCNERLREAYENGELDTERFTDRQLEQIANGDKPEGYTWHHHEDPGRMQLVDSKVHAETGHTGGRTIWGGGHR